MNYKKQKVTLFSFLTIAFFLGNLSWLHAQPSCDDNKNQEEHNTCNVPTASDGINQLRHEIKQFKKEIKDWQRIVKESYSLESQAKIHRNEGGSFPQKKLLPDLRKHILETENWLGELSAQLNHLVQLKKMKKFQQLSKSERLKKFEKLRIKKQLTRFQDSRKKELSLIPEEQLSILDPEDSTNES